MSVAAQGPFVAPDTTAPIAFEQTQFEEAHAGYVSLQWNDVLVDSAAEGTYVVGDQHGTIYYRGHLPMAFVSGLPDGVYRFDVKVVDAAGNVASRVSEPAVLRVEHWSLTQALSLFAVGAIVFLALIGVIVHGSLRGRRVRERLGAISR